MSKIITTASTYTELDAIMWLERHGARIDAVLACTVIELPEKALVEKDGQEWRYVISFYGPDGNREMKYVEVEHNIDANETILTLKKGTLG